MVVSTASSNTMEDVAAQAPDASRWYQLYWPADRDLAASFVRRAEAARYEAVVVTLDTWQLGWRPRDLSAAYLPFLQAQGVANYFADPVFRQGLEKTPEEDQGAAVLKFVGLFNNPTLTWDDIAFLRDHTSLPLVLKGIQHPDDVRRARDIGVQAVVCSNHGGRQVDGAIGSLDALPGRRRGGRRPAGAVRQRGAHRRRRVPRRWRSAPPPCCSAGRGCTASRSPARRACTTCCAASWPTSTCRSGWPATRR